MEPESVTRNVALLLLEDRGIAAIWQLHLDATELYRVGNRTAAASLISIADAAERELRINRAAASRR